MGFLTAFLVVLAAGVRSGWADLFYLRLGDGPQWEQWEGIDTEGG